MSLLCITAVTMVFGLNNSNVLFKTVFQMLLYFLPRIWPVLPLQIWLVALDGALEAGAAVVGEGALVLDRVCVWGYMSGFGQRESPQLTWS